MTDLPPAAGARERLGRIVRETWVKWAREQSESKPSWLVGWDELDESQQEVDMRIGEAVAAALPHLTPPPPEAAVADAVLALHKVAGGGEYCQEDGFLLAMPHGSGGAGRGSRAGGSR